MTPAPLLDTHVWIWWLLGDSRLSEREVSLLDEFPSNNRPALSAISLWELAMLVDLERIEMDMSLNEFLKTACSPETVRLIPLLTDVVVEMNNLPSSFHRDPADRLIVATANSQGLSLASYDGKIREAAVVSIWNP